MSEAIPEGIPLGHFVIRIGCRVMCAKADINRLCVE